MKDYKKCEHGKINAGLNNACIRNCSQPQRDTCTTQEFRDYEKELEVIEETLNKLENNE